MSGQGYNVTDILEEKSDHDQENDSDDSDEVPTSAKERNAKDYRIINNNDLSLKISRTNTLEEDNNKRKMEDDNENGKQQKQQDILDLTSQKINKNKKGNEGKEKKDDRTVTLKKLNTTYGGKEKAKNEAVKGDLRRNPYTDNLAKPTIGIAQKGTELSQRERFATQYQILENLPYKR